MANRRDLRLHEQILLLALRDEKGSLESRAGWWSMGLGGAILAELLLNGCVTVTPDKKRLVNVVKQKRFNDPVLDEALEMITTAKRRRNAARWVSAFANMSRLRHRVAERLCRRGILKDSEGKVLLIFTRKLYPTVDPEPEARLVGALRSAVFSDDMSVEPRTMILAALADVTGLLKVPFTRAELKSRKARLKQIREGHVVSTATHGAIEAVQAAQAAQVAVMAAVSAATIAASTASSG